MCIENFGYSLAAYFDYVGHHLRSNGGIDILPDMKDFFVIIVWKWELWNGYKYPFTVTWLAKDDRNR